MKRLTDHSSHRTAMIMAFLLDGEPHKWSEFRDYVYRQIDPRTAVKNYKRKFRGPAAAPLEIQIDKGRKITIRQTLDRLVDQGNILVEESDTPGQDEFVLRLTSKGLLDVRGAICGKIVGAVTRMYLRKDIDLTIKLSDKGNGFVLDEEKGGETCTGPTT